jgi:hypothetical protein
MPNKFNTIHESLKPRLPNLNLPRYSNSTSKKNELEDEFMKLDLQTEQVLRGIKLPN